MLAVIFRLKPAGQSVPQRRELRTEHGASSFEILREL
jgi:hypothetical protein